jgi:hypothetical protein
VFAHATSVALAFSQVVKLATTPSPWITPHWQSEAKSASLPESVEGRPVSSPSRAALPVANERRSSGFADEVPPPPPPEPGAGVSRVPTLAD